MHTTFFAAGGASMQAAGIIGDVNRVFDVQLPFRAMFEWPTVAELAATLRSRRSGWFRMTDPVVTLRAGGNDPPLFCVHAVGGTVFRYFSLASGLPAAVPVLGLQASGIEDGEAPDHSVGDMAARYVAAIRSRQRVGPYRLLGWSFRRLVAYEIACQLVASGDNVALVAMLDTPVPSTRPKPVDRERVLRALAAQLFGPIVFEPDWDAPPDITALAERAHRLGVAGMSERHARRLFDVVYSCLVATESYRPGRYPGELSIVRATCLMPGVRSTIDAQDWRKLTDIPPRIAGIACTHLDLGQPNLSPAIAAIVTPWLAETAAVGAEMYYRSRQRQEF